MTSKELIARRVAKEFKNNDIVNLGIGMPTMTTNYIPEGVNVTIQSEHGLLGMGPKPKAGEENWNLVDAGGQPASIISGGAFFDSAMSFTMIRGGHIDKTVLGALQVDQYGNLANWMIPGKLLPGMGGAMDLVVGAKKVIIAMEHTTKDGSPKILKECDLPLTACNQVDLIITNMAVIEVTKSGLVLKEIAPGLTTEEVQIATEAELIIGNDLKVMEI
ncbi:3-oxoacid CoA-transferase subunit B [Desulfosporosinus sp. PR]|uniref:3-oxoacid CoA-transferase subunit B n=1 Tax=Candidatus Desulfosporosinus nitrosoreducens TaxID=3401928 RepID=UPI0027E7A093|nr:3-oxoacid CoA-transferase subunit B [Desulfosporosinus sp. PR]MDQ7095435.1 3-oxoacid CoA-transferase subunit B [Desulfosporosinus sp. PR]